MVGSTPTRFRKMKKIQFPNNKKFAFTIIDDTDDSFLENTKPIYDFLFENGIFI